MNALKNLAFNCSALVALLVCLVGAQAHAAYQPSYTVLVEHHDLIVHSDATYEHEYTRVVRIDTESGVGELGEVSQSYNADLAALEVSAAYVVQPGGQRVEVSSDNIKVRDAYVDTDAPIFSNEKEVFIIFPKVQVGSELHYSFRKRVNEPYFQGQFNWLDYQLPWVPIESSMVSVSYAPALGLRFAVRGGYQEVAPKPGRSTPKGYESKQFSYTTKNVLPYESGGLSDLDTAPMVIASNWKSYHAVGLAYDQRSRPQAQPNQEITDLAKRLVVGASSERERVQRLHAWVAQNIRYVGTYVGAGGFVPNPASLILQRQYGDCKDHAALLEAMLAAVGIDSSPALINLGQAFQLMALPSTWPFNHVITYIPSLDLFVDATARYAPTGSLPLADMGKPVVITRTGAIKTTPTPLAERDTEMVMTQWVMHPNGDMSAKTEHTKTGWLEVASRDYNSDQDEIDQERWSRNYLQSQQEIGTGESHPPQSDDWSKVWRVSASAELQAVVNFPDPSAFAIPVGLAPGTLREFADTSPGRTRQRPWRCASRAIREISTIELPSRVEVQYLPKGQNIEARQWRYRSSFQLVGLQLRVEREMVLRFDRPWCDTELAPEWSDFLQQLRRDVRAQVFVRVF
jgi:hypothetical protein